jgi:hypothetical protein
MTLIMLVSAAVAAAPQPGILKTFGDWTVGCDNGRACHATALVPEDWPDDAMTMSVRRAAEADAAAIVEVDLRDKSGATGIAVDGKRLPVRVSASQTALTVDGYDRRLVLEALKTGQRLQLLGAGGAALGSISLKGASAALLYMDDQQKRVGTVTALTRPGEKPASLVPPPPPLPTVVQAAAPAGPPLKLSAREVSDLRKKLGCAIEDVGGPDYHEVSALGRGRNLVLLGCGSGAYNVSSVPVIAERVGRKLSTRPASFDKQESWWSEEGKPVLVNAEWDPKRRLLTSFSKARGLGDCGTGRDYAWDGERFRLAEQIDMDECRGSLDYITTWRVRLVSR